MQHSIRLDDIEIGERHRGVCHDAVLRLAGSLKEIGLKQPITVRIVEEMEVEGVLTAGVPVLVAGRHRLEAARHLGWSHIDCIEVADDALQAELWELAENLHRCDLTKEQRDEHIRRYAEVMELISRQSDAKSPQPVGRPQGVASKVAKATGLSKRTVERALQPPKPKPEPLPDIDVADNQFRSLMSAWNRACTDARDRFLLEIGRA